jgi:hypothetical protein
LDLYFSNDNRYLVSVFEKLNDLENEKDKVKCDSIKADLGILNLQDSLIHKVFNENEYNHLISQKTYSTWKTKNIDNKKIKITKKLKNYIYISKPIYSKDKEIAFIRVETSTLNSIYIYVHKNNIWSFYKLISPQFKQPRVEYIKN